VRGGARAVCLGLARCLLRREPLVAHGSEGDRLVGSHLVRELCAVEQLKLLAQLGELGGVGHLAALVELEGEERVVLDLHAGGTRRLLGVLEVPLPLPRVREAFAGARQVAVARIDLLLLLLLALRLVGAEYVRLGGGALAVRLVSPPRLFRLDGVLVGAEQLL
jgi:hypothetical protein